MNTCILSFQMEIKLLGYLEFSLKISKCESIFISNFAQKTLIFFFHPEFGSLNFKNYFNILKGRKKAFRSPRLLKPIESCVKNDKRVVVL